ncbi:selenocysteine-specific translation elongation factor [Crossiella sp. SN42]|uniref:selenocysteine-specific translation elongation factor n=1 Tax=Crossiella sp. SN42 TaxID=2944808 RepID=UPI00207D42FD|nr:selenocysteine-specific translation elongation factor [Crossiella sp. SN42]MCO1577958.1 selenocysteine-specific translation elongation factor [Crossiella sp. SN42]
MRVVATAGHVDHGKSTLVRLLTGMEPDRWAEERRRGLTIDLGFAWTTLSGQEIAFVDVPGHHRFVPNMLAGIGPVPAVLFVVAADEGWKPQSAEHLAAIRALGVRHLLLVITRADLADPETALRQAKQHLGQVPHVVVSATTGQGLDELRAAILALTDRLPAPEPAADVRLWLDRSFTVGGAGTVVTGTLSAGTIAKGEELQLASTGQLLRVRGLHTLGRQCDAVPAVARIAVNLRGVDRAELVRGDALLSPGRWRTATVVDVLVAAELPTELVAHLGSVAVPVRVRPLGTVGARLRLARPLPLRIGDRLLLRDPGRGEVLGGAEVVDLDPRPLRRGGTAARAVELTTNPLTIHLRTKGFARTDELRAAGLRAPEPVFADWHADPEHWAAVVRRAPGEVESWRQAHPLEPGMPAEALRQRLDLPEVALIGPLANAAGLAVSAGRVGGAVLPARMEQALGALAAELAGNPFAAPDLARLAELGLGGKEVAAAVRAGRLLRVAEGVVLLPEAVTQAANVLARLAGPFTVSQARQALGTSRRVAVPLLELLDRRGITERLADSSRRLR